MAMLIAFTISGTITVPDGAAGAVPNGAVTAVPAAAPLPDQAIWAGDTSAASICAFVISKYWPPLFVATARRAATSLAGGAIAITYSGTRRPEKSRKLAAAVSRLAFLNPLVVSLRRPHDQDRDGAAAGRVAGKGDQPRRLGSRIVDHQLDRCVDCIAVVVARRNERAARPDILCSSVRRIVVFAVPSRP